MEKSTHQNRTARIKGKLEPYFYLLPTVALMALLLFVPIFLVISYSFYDNVIINDNPVWVGFENYATVLGDAIFVKSMKNTAIFVVLNVIFHLLIGMGFALMVNAKSLGPRPKAFFRIIYMLPWMFNATVIAILWKLLLNGSGVINYLLTTFHITEIPLEWLSDRSAALWVLTFINIWAGYPFYMISTLAGLQGIPDSLYESASIDGANGLQKFWHITLPQLRPILISIAMLDFIWTTQNFSLIWLLTAGGPAHATEMMSTYVYKTAFQSYQYSLASAAAVIILIACVILAIFYVRSQTRNDE
ncbi:sugar ABC transporter permease [Ruminococcaceae bacterium OttesenSCG-928-I18]|nr:sugar ABC transporter permease [Ruminococcaceae bacterium OttesenSCG-928-I18]